MCSRRIFAENSHTDIFRGTLHLFPFVLDLFVKDFFFVIICYHCLHSDFIIRDLRNFILNWHCQRFALLRSSRNQKKKTLSSVWSPPLFLISQSGYTNNEAEGSFAQCFHQPSMDPVSALTYEKQSFNYKHLFSALKEMPLRALI